MTSSDQVDVKVENRLSRIGTDVEHGAISFFNAAVARNLGRREVTAADQFSFFRCRFFQSANVFLGNHQNVGRSLRIDVFKGEGVVVFVNFLRRNLAFKNAAEQALVHGKILNSRGISGKESEYVGRVPSPASREATSEIYLDNPRPQGTPRTQRFLEK